MKCCICNGIIEDWEVWIRKVGLPEEGSIKPTKGRPAHFRCWLIIIDKRPRKWSKVTLSLFD